MPDNIEDLLASGVPIPDDPAELAALLEAQEETPAEVMGDGPIDPDPDLGDPKQTKAAEPEKEPEPSKDNPASEDTDNPAEDKDAPSEDPDPVSKAPSAPPPAVLKQTRERLHTAREERDQERAAREAIERENAQLKNDLAKAQDKFNTEQEQLQNAADNVADGKVTLSTDSEAQIREKLKDYESDIVDVIVSMKATNEALMAKLGKVDELAEQQEQRERQTAQDRVNEALNENPMLALLRDDESERGNELWGRAVNYDQALRADPDWQDKSEIERFAEVDRRMRGYLGEEGVRALLGEEPAKPENQPKKESNPVTEPVPSSLSDLPSVGRPAAQSSAEQVEALSVMDLEDRLDKILESGGDVNDYIGKLMSNVDG